MAKTLVMAMLFSAATNADNPLAHAVVHPLKLMLVLLFHLKNKHICSSHPGLIVHFIHVTQISHTKCKLTVQLNGAACIDMLSIH